MPQVVYGFFAVNADGDELIVWQDGNRSIESTRFTFPRQHVEPYLCIADFFRPDRVGRARLRRVPHRHDGRARVSRRRPSCSPRTGTRTICCCTGSASRWPRRSRRCGTAGSGRSGASPTRTGRRSRGCSASSTGAAATRGATRRAPTSRTMRRSQSCSAGRDRCRGQRRDLVAVPPGADDLRDHLPPPAGEVLRRPGSGSGSGCGVVLASSGEGLVEDSAGLGHTLVAERARGVVEPPLIVVRGFRSRRAVVP